MTVMRSVSPWAEAVSGESDRTYPALGMHAAQTCILLFNEGQLTRKNQNIEKKCLSICQSFTESITNATRYLRYLRRVEVVVFIIIENNHHLAVIYNSYEISVLFLMDTLTTDRADTEIDNFRTSLSLTSSYRAGNNNVFWIVMVRQGGNLPRSR